MERAVKPGRRTYNKFSSDLVFFTDFKLDNSLPWMKEDSKEFKYEQYRHKGFDLVSITNQLVQTGRYEVNHILQGYMGIDSQSYGNYEKYGTFVGAVYVPSIVRYNLNKQSYYGLFGINIYRLLDGDCKLLKYDEHGHITSVRNIYIDNNKVDLTRSKCDKSLEQFINDTIEIYNSSNEKEIFMLRGNIIELKDYVHYELHKVIYFSVDDLISMPFSKLAEQNKIDKE